jgi:hypothetical protein
VKVDVDVRVSGEPAAPAKPRRNARTATSAFNGLSLKFGWGERDQRYSPIVLSSCRAFLCPGMYDTNLAIGYIGSLTRSVKGLSASGVMDLIDKDLLGVQTPGFFPRANAVGVQASGCST